MSIKDVVFQSPTSLRDRYMRLMATKQQPHLNMGRKGTWRSIQVDPYIYYSGAAKIAGELA